MSIFVNLQFTLLSFKFARPFPHIQCRKLISSYDLEINYTHIFFSDHDLQLQLQDLRRLRLQEVRTINLVFWKI